MICDKKSCKIFRPCPRQRKSLSREAICLWGMLSGLTWSQHFLPSITFILQRNLPNCGGSDRLLVFLQTLNNNDRSNKQEWLDNCWFQTVIRKVTELWRATMLPDFGVFCLVLFRLFVCFQFYTFKYKRFFLFLTRLSTVTEQLKEAASPFQERRKLI